VWLWQRRYAESGVDGLLRDKTRPSGKAPVPRATVARVLALNCAEPPGETTHWTSRAMAKAVGVSLRTIQRIWQAQRLATAPRPHLQTLQQPRLRRKGRGYRRPLHASAGHAVVLSIDEKSQIQALDRTRPTGPAREAWQMRHHDP